MRKTRLLLTIAILLATVQARGAQVAGQAWQRNPPGRQNDSRKTPFAHQRPEIR
jgi:hypothetical protein